MRPPEAAVPGEASAGDLDQLLAAIYERYGFDFRNYARPCVQRRVEKYRRETGATSLAQLTEALLADESAMQDLLDMLSISVTSMFRDPEFFLLVRNEVLPILRTYPSIRVWVAGCASGEEAYSLAILLEEEGVYERCRIYATDVNEVLLSRAKAGTFSLQRMQGYTENYQRTGPRAAFSDYYHASEHYAALDSRLGRHIVFAHHDLVHDGPFNEFHLILCRNVLIYFDQQLQARVVARFLASLRMFGVLGLGSQESLQFGPHASRFVPIHEQARLYRRVH